MFFSEDKIVQERGAGDNKISDMVHHFRYLPAMNAALFCMQSVSVGNYHGVERLPCALYRTSGFLFSLHLLQRLYFFIQRVPFALEGFILSGFIF
jgi:hypothetical protein